MPITCKECGGPHLRINCPSLSPDMRARSLDEMMEKQELAEEAKPFHCKVFSYPGKSHHVVHADSCDEFWTDIHFSQEHSIYRDFAGIVSMADQNKVYPADFPDVPPGQYVAVGRTLALSDKELYTILDDAKEALGTVRPLSVDKVRQVHKELCLCFTHFSLQHEGNHLEYNEIEMITNLLAGGDELDEIKDAVKGSEHDLLEAINHIRATESLSEIAAQGTVSEEMVLGLHQTVTEGLLTDVEEGMAGEYRKCAINVVGEDTLRPNFAATSHR